MPLESRKLSNLRHKLEILNYKFLDLLDKRLELVKGIQQEKKKLDHSVDIWTPDREYYLFKKFVEQNPYLDFRVDFMYSLLIEYQACMIGDYPVWSEHQHLNSVQNNLFERINPLLLYLRDRKKWEILDLKEEYKAKLTGIDHG